MIQRKYSPLQFDVVLLCSTVPNTNGLSMVEQNGDPGMMKRRRGADFCIRTFPSLLMSCVFSCNFWVVVARGSVGSSVLRQSLLMSLCCYILEGLWHCRPTCRTCNTCHSLQACDAILVGRGAVITPPTHQGFRCLNLSRKHGGVACLMRFFHITKVEMSGLIHPFLSMVLFCCDKEWGNCPDQKALAKNPFVSLCFENIFINDIDLTAVPRYAYIRNSLARLCFHRSVAESKLFQNHVKIFEGLLTLAFIDGER